MSEFSMVDISFFESSFWSVSTEVASLLGFLVSVFVLIQTVRIKNSMVSKARVPQILEELGEISQDLDKAKASGEIADADGCVSRIKALLSNLKSKIPKAERDELARCLKLIKASQKVVDNHDRLARYHEVYTSLMTVEMAVDQHVKDSRLS